MPSSLVYTDQEAALIDPQLRIFHETTYEALIDAGIQPSDLRGANIGVYHGRCYKEFDAGIKEDEFRSKWMLQDYAERISQNFGFTGPSFSCDSACASSFSALNQAVKEIQAGIIDMAIIGGIQINLNPAVAHGFGLLNMTSDDGKSKCLDERAGQ